VVRQIEAQGGLTFARLADVTSKEEARGLVAEAESRWPNSLAVLVNNAGITVDRSFKKRADADWHRVIEVNLHGGGLYV
jgi:NAD(P)-dependent dehydrogenase (short-subunit alcohol dehydrogenase family)